MDESYNNDFLLALTPMASETIGLTNTFNQNKYTKISEVITYLQRQQARNAQAKERHQVRQRLQPTIVPTKQRILVPALVELDVLAFNEEGATAPSALNVITMFQGPKADNKVDVKDKKTETPSSTPAIPRANRVQVATFSVGNAVFEDEILDFSSKTQFASALYPCSANSLTLIEPTALSTKSSRMRACVDSGCTGNIIKVRPAHAITGTVSNPLVYKSASNNSVSKTGETVTLPIPGLTLENVEVAPDISKSLISVWRLLQQGYDVWFNHSDATVNIGALGHGLKPNIMRKKEDLQGFILILMIRQLLLRQI
ncbi:hypothetical protein HDU67_002691 [Dinochytrium kinnereticum]|nr:hypothetical protein HDU67_002691 [Dinochytrium kinnereticum]